MDENPHINPHTFPRHSVNEPEVLNLQIVWAVWVDVWAIFRSRNVEVIPRGRSRLTTELSWSDESLEADGRG
jgi:hypothetical protein